MGVAAHRDREGEERQGDADGGTRRHGVVAHEEGEVERGGGKCTGRVRRDGGDAYLEGEGETVAHGVTQGGTG